MLGDNQLRYNIANKKICVFDLETSCLNLVLPYNKPWQASWLDTRGYKTVGTYDYLIKWPDFYISPGAALVTRYNPYLVEQKGYDPKEVLEKLDSFLYNPEYLIIGQNLLNFDVYVHSMWRESVGLKPDFSYLDRLIDIRALAVAFKLGLKFKEDESLLAQQYKFLDYKQRGFKTNLSQLCRDFQIPFDPEKMHDGLYDVEKTLEVFTPLVKVLDL